MVACDVRLLGEQRGLFLAESARQTGPAKLTLSNLEQCAGHATVDTLFAIPAALGVPVTRLVAERQRMMTVQQADDVVREQHDG